MFSKTSCVNHNLKTSEQSIIFEITIWIVIFGTSKPRPGVRSAHPRPSVGAFDPPPQNLASIEKNDNTGRQPVGNSYGIISSLFSWGKYEGHDR